MTLRAAEVSRAAKAGTGLEASFDAAFTTALALREKQIQQNYRPIIGIHKWFARRPGTVFRALMLAEFSSGPLSEAFWQAHHLEGTIGDPFMGGGTPVFEANRLGFHVVGCDINPMSHWLVRQSLAPLDLQAYAQESASVIEDVKTQLGTMYATACGTCGEAAAVKYFLWVKTSPCPHCGKSNDLFPGYRLAEAERHPKHVLVCSQCGELNEYDEPPKRADPASCKACGHDVHLEGNVQRKRATCTDCHQTFALDGFDKAPEHRMWALEYHCKRCYSSHPGRQFKRPDADDLSRYTTAERQLADKLSSLPIPTDEIPAGDESDRLHRWGYRRYHEMFGARQLLGLGLLLRRIQQVEDTSIRHALLTVFSDTLRYQNMLCRYDTYALKCQDIFSVHGFPVALVQCENNLLGIERVGSGSFCHFVEKYARAKQYCKAPFETRQVGRKKEQVQIPGESILAEMIDRVPPAGRPRVKQAFLVNAPSQSVPLKKNSLDGVFTDPPYFDNVQYAELIDFCFAWLRQALRDEMPSFDRETTRSEHELTGNLTLGRDLAHFTQGLSEVFSRFASALKPGGPFVFTYHHNDPAAYLPLVVAILDAGLECSATLPAAAEMTASLHISGTGSSILDSVFVCRRCEPDAARRNSQGEIPLSAGDECREAIKADGAAMQEAGLKVTAGDLRCLIAGHIARIVISNLRAGWNRGDGLDERMLLARTRIAQATRIVDVAAQIETCLGEGTVKVSKKAGVL